MKQLTQVQYSDQAVHKHLSLRPEVQLEMTLVQEHHTNLQEQIQAPQPRVEGDPEEGHTSKVSIAACTAIQEPHSVPDLEEMSSSGLTSRHLLHDALQPMEQMNSGYQETHASSLATPAGAVSHFVSSDDHQASPPACLMDMGAPQPRDAHPPIFRPSSLRSERRKEDCCQLECTTRVHSARGYEGNVNILVPGNIALDGDDRPRVKVNGKTEPQRRWPPRQQSGQHSQGGDDQIVVPGSSRTMSAEPPSAKKGRFATPVKATSPPKTSDGDSKAARHVPSSPRSTGPLNKT
ncbi:hypothetical protein F2P81_007461 [Scophthalmus maximus]|uniref:Uncharacterized protein n=1 Tax=Scophthalmus maximus TaxID=52904 RepID=A0A6A4SVG3_SCOMX|nr:hypothetical protein F2P81_007461 [Scophthalmus maximus]